MESLPIDIILKFNPDTLVKVRKEFGLEKPGAVKDAVDILEGWAKKQNHFVKKNFDREYLERYIISAKGSVERAKQRLDKICTIKTLIPRFFEHVDIENDLVKDLHEKVYHVVLPKPTAEYDRVFLATCYGDQFTPKILFNAYVFDTMMVEYTKRYDYAISNQIVVDYRLCNLSAVLASTNLNDLRQLATIIIDGYGVKLKAIHILTESKLIDVVVNIAKQLVPRKIADRIFVHKTLDTLYNHVTRDILPEDFGGKEKPIKEIHAKWVEVLCSNEYREYQRDIYSACTDESRRHKDTFNELYMGMPGSFRALSVD